MVLKQFYFDKIDKFIFLSWPWKMNIPWGSTLTLLHEVLLKFLLAPFSKFFLDNSLIPQRQQVQNWIKMLNGFMLNSLSFQNTFSCQHLCFCKWNSYSQLPKFELILEHFVVLSPPHHIIKFCWFFSWNGSWPVPSINASTII